MRSATRENHPPLAIGWQRLMFGKRGAPCCRGSPGLTADSVRQPPYGNLTGLWQIPHSLVNAMGILLLAEMLDLSGTSNMCELISLVKYS